MASDASDVSNAKVPGVVSTNLIVVSVVFPLLSLSSIMLRYKARKMAQLVLQADDWWIVAAWISTLGISVNAWVFASIVGVNYYKVNPIIGIFKSLQCLQVSGLILQVSLSVVKISILLLYKRIFSTPKFRVFTWIGIAVVSAWGIVFFLLILLIGDPLNPLWADIERYFDAAKLGLAQIGTSIAFDFIVLIYPLPIIFTLHLSTRKKVAITLIFWLGAFCCFTAIVRLILLHTSLTSLSVMINDSSMVSTQAKQFIFMILEPNCSIIAACLPCCGPLLAGGRTLESLIQSFLSFFPLRSYDNAKASSISQTQDQTKDSDTLRAGTTYGGSEPQAKLPPLSREWFDPRTRVRSPVCSRQHSNNSDEEMEIICPRGIRELTKVYVPDK